MSSARVSQRALNITSETSVTSEMSGTIMEISDRKRTILTALITIHTNSGYPVGSDLLADFLDTLSVSSATLRNEMAELTSLGLLEQPYTSAGRIPTTLGIRYYIDNLMNLWAMDNREKEHIKGIVTEMDSDPEKITESSAAALADMFSLSAVAMTPRGINPHLVHFNLLKIGKYNYALVGVTNAGSIQSRVDRINLDLSESELKLIETVFNRYLVFISPEDIKAELPHLITVNGLSVAATTYMPFISSALSLIESLTAFRLYTDGEHNLLSYRDMYSQILPYLEYINDTKRIVPMLVRRSDNPISIYIGEEIDHSLTNMGMVTGHFKAGNSNGHLAVTGPARMNYAYIVPRLKYFCETLSEAFSE